MALQSVEFEKHVLISLIVRGQSPGLELVRHEVTGDRGGYFQYTLVFKVTEQGKFYEVTYDRTYYQPHFQDEGDYVQCTEVRPVQETVTFYKPVHQ